MSGDIQIDTTEDWSANHNLADISQITNECLTPKYLIEINRTIHDLNSLSKKNPQLPKREKYLYVRGDKNGILVCAPHCVRHYRGEWKVQDVNVHLIALFAARRTGCHALIPLTLIRDPNYWQHPLGRETPFAKAVMRICEAARIEMLIDVHRKAGCHASVSVGGDFYSPVTGPITKLNTQLEGEFSKEKIKILHEARFSGGDLTRFVSEKRGIPSLQLEISAALRIPDIVASQSPITRAMEGFINEVTKANMA